MKILVIQTAFIGDVVLTTAMLRAIQKKYPETNIDFIGVSSGCEVLKDFPNLTTHPLRKKPMVLGFNEMVRKFNEVEFDIIFCVHRSLRSLLLAKKIKAKRKVSFSSFFSKIFGFDSIPYPKYSEDVHYAEKPLKLIEKDIGKIADKLPSLYNNQTDQIWANQQIENFTKRSYFVLSPFSVWGTKMWFADRFAKACIELCKNSNVAVVITGANNPQERIIASTIAEKVIQSGGEALNLVGQTTMGQLKAVIQKSKLVLSNDSAAVHIAAAFQVPTVAIFGPTVKKWGFFPLSNQSTVVERKDLICRPCSLHGPQKCPKVHFKCMNEIQVDEVVQAVRKYI